MCSTTIHKFVYFNARLLEMLQWNADSQELYSEVKESQSETGNSICD